MHVKSMTKIVLRSGFMSLVLFLAFIMVIHAQPYDDSDLRALLVAPDCQIPCFMGIRPGITTLDEAAGLLKSSGWVYRLIDRRNLGMFSWTWNGTQPAFIDGSQKAWLQPDPLHPTVVNSINIPTVTSIGKISLILGKLYAYRMQFFAGGVMPQTGILAYYSINYSNYPISANGTVDCPLRWINFWTSTAIITYRVNAAQSETDWGDQLRHNSWCA